jgi:myo-inositol-1(or 4)-monophosphatase
VWIIDPLDGTTNFIHGFPVYAVSIALAFKGQVQQAVVYDPSRNDLFYASKGRGAFLNDKRLRVSKRIRMADCLIGTGFPFRKGDNFQRYLRMFEAVMQHCAGLRRPGAAALDLCYVAAGYTDGFFETGLSPWDVAAGSLLVTEAGGLVGNFTGDADYLYQREVVAGNPKIYAQLVTLLAPYTRMLPAATAGAADTHRDAPAGHSELTPEAALIATEGVVQMTQSRLRCPAARRRSAFARARRPTATNRVEPGCGADPRRHRRDRPSPSSERMLKDVLAFAQVARRDALAAPRAPESAERHLREAEAWLCRAHDASRDGGVSYGYSLRGGWRPSYPETSGYIATTFFRLARDRDPSFLERAQRILRWLVAIQNADGSFCNRATAATASCSTPARCCSAWCAATRSREMRRCCRARGAPPTG